MLFIKKQETYLTRQSNHLTLPSLRFPHTFPFYSFSHSNKLLRVIVIIVTLTLLPFAQLLTLLNVLDFLKRYNNASDFSYANTPALNNDKSDMYHFYDTLRLSYSFFEDHYFLLFRGIQRQLLRY